jgi:nucleotide-binding universal stress UspA family protein
MPVIGERVSVSVKEILLATDFSSASEKAASYVRALARRFSSTVEIAHVFDPSIVTSYEEAIVGLPVNERRRIANENLERLRDDYSASGIDVRTISPEGHRPSAGLLKVAKEWAGLQPHLTTLGQRTSRPPPPSETPSLRGQSDDFGGRSVRTANALGAFSKRLSQGLDASKETAACGHSGEPRERHAAKTERQP